MTRNDAIERAIEQSISQNEIVTIDDISPGDIEALTLESDDSVTNGTVIEFWGQTDDGETWRVHVCPPVRNRGVR